jgi:hypothetical protein
MLAAEILSYPISFPSRPVQPKTCYPAPWHCSASSLCSLLRFLLGLRLNCGRSPSVTRLAALSLTLSTLSANVPSPVSTVHADLFHSQLAAPGDTVEFTYNPKNHSVTQTTFEYPCVHKPFGFDSFLYVPSLSGAFPRHLDMC